MVRNLWPLLFVDPFRRIIFLLIVFKHGQKSNKITTLFKYNEVSHMIKSHSAVYQKKGHKYHRWYTYHRLRVTCWGVFTLWSNLLLSVSPLQPPACSPSSSLHTPTVEETEWPTFQSAERSSRMDAHRSHIVHVTSRPRTRRWANGQCGRLKVTRLTWTSFWPVSVFQDYITVEGDLSYSPGETQKIVPVRLLELTERDGLLDDKQVKQFVLDLSNPRQGAKLGRYPRTTVTIADQPGKKKRTILDTEVLIKHLG